MSKQIDKVFRDVLKKTYEEYELLFSKEATTEYKNAMIQGVLETCEEDPQTARFFTFILPLTHLLSQLFTQNRSVFNKVVSWVEEENLFSFVPRLKKDVIYEILLSLDENISKSILGKLDCDEDTYHRLCENLQNKTVFLSLIGQCNTSGISRYLWTSYFPIAVKNIVSTWADGNVKEDDAAEMGSILRDELQNVNDDELAQGYKIGASLDVINDDAVFELFYTVCLWKYLEQAKKTHLDGKITLELESIFAQPAFEKQYEEISQLYNDGKLIQQISQLAEPYPHLRNIFETAMDEGTKELRTSKTLAEVEAQKEADRKRKEAEAFNLIKELLTNTAGEEDFFKDGFTLEHLETFFKIILTDKRVLDDLTKTEKRMIYVYKGIVLEKFCNIIGYLIHKGVISDSQVQVAEVLFGIDETKTAIFNWKPVDKNSREAVDREVNIITTLSSYISNGFNNNSKSFIISEIQKWFDETLDSVRKPQ